MPVSVSFSFGAAGRLTRVVVKSHIGDASRCGHLPSILSAMEEDYGSQHTRAQGPAATSTVYEWAPTLSPITYKVDQTPSACEIELAYALNDYGVELYGRVAP